MYQISVHSAVAVLEGVDVDEAERQDRGGQHRVDLPRCATVEGCESIYQRGQILRFRTDVIGQRLLCLPVVHADKPALQAQAEMHEAGVADHDALQAA